MRDYLVVSDYGSGGLWAIVGADDSSRILYAYPEVGVVAEIVDRRRVVGDRPSWLSARGLRQLYRRSFARLGVDPCPVLDAVVADRGSRSRLEVVADAYVQYSGLIADASHEQRARLEGSPSQNMWRYTRSAFTSGSADCVLLVDLILERMPAARIPQDVGQELVEPWLSSARAEEAQSWISTHLDADERLSRMLSGFSILEWRPDGAG